MKRFQFSLSALLTAIVLFGALAGVAWFGWLKGWLEERTIARNQIAAAAACKQFAEAEEIYSRTDRNHDGVLEYAQSLKGDNSLFENKAGAADLRLIDKRFADAEGAPGKAIPKNGYVFKVLIAQGPSATGGRHSYLPDGKHMLLGYALIACPAVYGETGRDTFLININGTIFQTDLGPKTIEIYNNTTEFNPEKGTWSGGDDA